MLSYKNIEQKEADEGLPAVHPVRKNPTRSKANNLQKNQTETDIFSLSGRYIV